MKRIENIVKNHWRNLIKMAKRLFDVILPGFKGDKLYVLKEGMAISKDTIEEVITQSAIETKESVAILYLTNSEYTQLIQDKNYNIK